MKIRRTLAAAAGATLLTMFATVTQATAAPATAASPDFDQDGKADLAVSLYDDEAETYTVRVWYGSGEISDIQPSDVGAPGIDDLNGPLLARDLNDDGFTDLVFTAGVYENGAKVAIALGSEAGLLLEDLPTYSVSTSPSAAPASLALVEDPSPRLAVGVKTGYTNGTGAGRVAVFDLGSNGLPVSATPLLLKSGTSRIPTVSGSAPGFGTSLDSSGNRLFIGAPFATVSGKTNAGAVIAATFSASGVSSAKLISQSTTGVTGVAASEDRFGASLAARGNDLVIGTPLDHVGSLKDTGSVQVISLKDGALKPVNRISQSSSGVPGKSEQYDSFGSSVALGSVCADVTSVIIGGKGEQLGTSKSAGSVWTIPVRTGTGCTASQLYEGHGFTGTPGAGVGLGAFVAVLRDAGDSVDDVVVGGRGGFSEGPDGKVIRWGPTAETFRFTALIAGVAGR